MFGSRAPRGSQHIYQASGLGRPGTQNFGKRSASKKCSLASLKRNILRGLGGKESWPIFRNFLKLGGPNMFPGPQLKASTGMP